MIETATEFVQQIAGVTDKHAWHDEDQHNERCSHLMESRSHFTTMCDMVSSVIRTSPLIPLPTISTWRDGSSRRYPIEFSCNSALELKAVVLALGYADKEFDEDAERQQLRWLKPYGDFEFNIIAFRGDQSCELVEVLDDDGKPVMEEITVTEQERPARYREIVKQVPVTRRNCPPLLGD